MPSTRSGASASPGAGAGEDAAQLLEDAAAELSSQVAARRAAEERVAALEAQLAEQAGADVEFGTPGQGRGDEEEEVEEEDAPGGEEGVEAGAGLDADPAAEQLKIVRAAVEGWDTAPK